MKYIAFFDLQEFGEEKRSVAPSAANVVRYEAEVMSEFCPIEIISPSRTLKPKGRYPGRRNSISDRVSLVQPPTFGAKTRVGTVLSVLQIRVWLFLYLLKHLEVGETVVVYHSLSHMDIIRWLKHIKKLKIILEIREIYTDVKDSYSGLKDSSSRLRKKEMKYFKIADQYIFPTELLNSIINVSNKPYLIATGIYKPEEEYSEKLLDGMIHVVYAGTLRKEKGGAAAAVAAAALLPENYYIHILGYGSEADTKLILEQIKVISARSRAKVSYDGLLRGKAFTEFLQKCHIGLATQDPSGSFNDTSFPSKILTYFINDLEVVSCRIRAVTDSPVGQYIHYYNLQTPEEIAKSIMLVDLASSQSKRTLMLELDKQLRKSMKKFLS